MRGVSILIFLKAVLLSHPPSSVASLNKTNLIAVLWVAPTKVSKHEVNLYKYSTNKAPIGSNGLVVGLGYLNSNKKDKRWVSIRFALWPFLYYLFFFLCFHVLPGLRVGNEILSINGEAVSDLDLRQMELLFSERSVMLTVRTSHCGTQQPLCVSWSDGDISRDPKSLLPPPNQSQLLEEFLDNFKKNTANGKKFVNSITFTSLRISLFLKTQSWLKLCACLKNTSTNYLSSIYAQYLLLFSREQKWNRIWLCLQGNDNILICFSVPSSIIKCSLNCSVSSWLSPTHPFPRQQWLKWWDGFQKQSIVLCLPCFLCGKVPHSLRVPSVP